MVRDDETEFQLRQKLRRIQADLDDVVWTEEDKENAQVVDEFIR